MAAIIRTVLLLGLILSVGCGGSSNPQQPPAASTTGSWSFVGVSLAFHTTFSATANMQQQGSDISGTVILSGPPCTQNLTLNGTISGSMVRLQLRDGAEIVMNMTTTVTPDGSSISGTYNPPTASCMNGDVGNFTGRRDQVR